MSKFFVNFVDKNTVFPERNLLSAAFLIALEGSKILAIKNDRGWELPGGHIEEGETVEEALIREVREEAGATFSDAKLLAIIGSTTEGKYKDKVMLMYATNNFKLEKFTPSEDALDRKVIEIEEFLKRHKGIIDFAEMVARARNLVFNRDEKSS